MRTMWRFWQQINWQQWGKFAVAGAAGGLTMAIVLSLSAGSNGPTTVLNRNETLTIQEDSAIVNAVEKVLPSVVSVVSSQNVRSIFGGIFEQRGGGTGFVISSDGLIATNKHVVSSDQATYQVITSDGKNYDARVVARDPIADLAIIKISARDLPVVEFGDSDKLALGQRVIAIGNTLGEYQNTVTTGVISGIDRVITAIGGAGVSERLEGVIQTDAAINPGNSGGPLVNLAGQVIGINTAVDAQGQSVGFAIPIKSIQSAIESYLKGGEILRPRLGVRYIPITKEFAALNKLTITEGALVARGETAAEVAVQPGSPADLAGIKEGDILVSINNDKITEQTGLAGILQKYQPGDSVSVKFVRQGKEQTVNVRLGKL